MMSERGADAGVIDAPARGLARGERLARRVGRY